MIRRPPRSTQSRSSAASDVYKRQTYYDQCQSSTTSTVVKSAAGTCFACYAALYQVPGFTFFIIVKLLMRLMLQYRANKCVFKSLRKLSLLTLRSVKLSSNEFQADGPATEKARRPYVHNRCRGRTRSRRLADLRCCREATSETGRQRSTKYCAPDVAGN